jgi:hypothetical protein
MAGTSEDNTTANVWLLPATDWLLLSNALAFVTQYTRSEKAAKKLIVDQLCGRGTGYGRRLRHRCPFAEGHQGDFEPTTDSDEFWREHPERAITVEIDWEASSIRRRAPCRSPSYWPTHIAVC